jgi:hypothetical protein
LGNGSFQAARNYAVGNGPSGIAIGDFNGDGKADLAVANSGSNYVSVLLGNGDGTFQAAVNVAVGYGQQSIVVGDFNGDGKADLAVLANNGTNYVSVLLGNGDGTFQAPVNSVVGPGPMFLAIGDFNRDGQTDLVAVNYGDVSCPSSALCIFSNTLSILLRNGEGGFLPPIYYSTRGNTVAVGDLTGDGKADLAVGLDGGFVTMLVGNGDGTFLTGGTYQGMAGGGGRSSDG